MMSRRTCSLVLTAVLLTSAACATTTRVITVPEGAAVHVDGEYVGTTPLVYYDSSSLPKRHRLQFSLEGHRVEEFYVDRELSLIFTLMSPCAFGLPLFWAWGLPDRLVVNLRPLPEEAATIEEETAPEEAPSRVDALRPPEEEPAEEPAEEPDSPPVEAAPGEPEPAAAKPAPLTEPRVEEEPGVDAEDDEEQEEQEEEDDLDLVVPPPPPPLPD